MDKQQENSIIEEANYRSNLAGNRYNRDVQKNKDAKKAALRKIEIQYEAELKDLTDSYNKEIREIRTRQRKQLGITI